MNVNCQEKEEKNLSEDKKENYNIDSLINSIQLTNLNDYYDIETSIFRKRCEKLNLLFYNETESLPPQKEIPYPYNKLFVILFKEISVYIEEIERLNKQLRQNEKKEKSTSQNKISNKKEIVKKSNVKKDTINVKKTHKESDSSSLINSQLNKYSVNKTNKLLNSDKKVKEKIKENSILNEEDLKNSKISKKKMINTNKEVSSHQSLNNELNGDLIERCLNQYDDELYNLKGIEEFLLNQKKILNSKKKNDKIINHKKIN